MTLIIIYLRRVVKTIYTRIVISRLTISVHCFGKVNRIKWFIKDNGRRGLRQRW